jgi:hypothetical protein
VRELKARTDTGHESKQDRHHQKSNTGEENRAVSTCAAGSTDSGSGDTGKMLKDQSDVQEPKIKGADLETKTKST